MHGLASSQYSTLPVSRIQGLDVEAVITDTFLTICFSMVKKLRRSDLQYQHGTPLAIDTQTPQESTTVLCYYGALHWHKKRVAQLYTGSGS